MLLKTATSLISVAERESGFLMSPPGGSPVWPPSLSLPGIRESNTNIARPSNYHTLHERHPAASGNTNRCLIKDMRKTEEGALYYSNDGDNIRNCSLTCEVGVHIFHGAKPRSSSMLERRTV